MFLGNKLNAPLAPKISSVKTKILIHTFCLRNVRPGSKLSSTFRIRSKSVGVQSLLEIICRLFHRGYCFMPYSWNWPTPINESRYEPERLWLSNYQRIEYVLASAVLIFLRSPWGNVEIVGRSNCKSVFVDIFLVKIRYFCCSRQTKAF